MSEQKAVTMDEALDALHREVEVACAVVQRRGDWLSLEETADVMESAVVALDGLLAIVKTVVERTAVIQERELVQRRGSAVFEVMDQVALHLRYGSEVVEGGRHLLGMGWGELVRVARGEV